MLDRNRPAATTITHDPPIHVRVVEWKRRPEPLPPSRRSVPKRSHPVRPGQTRRTHGSEAFEGPQQLADRRRDTGDQPQGPVRITHRASAEPSAPGSPFVAHERPAAAARRSGAGTIDLSSVLPADPGRRPRRTAPGLCGLESPSCCTLSGMRAVQRNEPGLSQRTTRCLR